MIASYVAAAASAPLRARPSILEAEVHAIAERDHRLLFSAALAQWVEERDATAERGLFEGRAA